MHFVEIDVVCRMFVWTCGKNLLPTWRGTKLQRTESAGQLPTEDELSRLTNARDRLTIKPHQRPCTHRIDLLLNSCASINLPQIERVDKKKRIHAEIMFQKFDCLSQYFFDLIELSGIFTIVGHQTTSTSTPKVTWMAFMY